VSATNNSHLYICRSDCDRNTIPRCLGSEHPNRMCKGQSRQYKLTEHVDSALVITVIRIDRLLFYGWKVKLECSLAGVENRCDPVSGVRQTYPYKSEGRAVVNQRLMRRCTLHVTGRAVSKHTSRILSILIHLCDTMSCGSVFVWSRLASTASMSVCMGLFDIN
jgi:hypothetical protein